jgi:hypothetical protein
LEIGGAHSEAKGTILAGARLMSDLYDTIVIGAGQAGLASAYYLQRAGNVAKYLQAYVAPVLSLPDQGTRTS